jgi:nicotinamide mononucleotide transporter
MNLSEIFAVSTALIYVYFATKQNRICFLFGFISSAIYIYITFQSKLYFDSGINLFYVGMSVVGWINWGKEGKKDITTHLKSKKLKLTLVIGIALSFVLGFFANNFTDANLPYFDAFTTVFSVIGTIWLVEKYIENWAVWIVVDAVAAGMYFYKELYLTSALFLLYTFIAIKGWLAWNKEISR